MIIDAEVHAAIRTAVPLPGICLGGLHLGARGGEPQAPVRRDDNYLGRRPSGSIKFISRESWRRRGMAADICAKASPHHHRGARLERQRSPGGRRPGGTNFLCSKDKSTTGEARYDRQEFHTVAAIERNLQLGLAWQVRSTDKATLTPGTAIALRVPLLPGEKVLSANTNVKTI